MLSHLGATLEVNLTALAANYRLLKARHAQGNIACVVKANAYGLGVNAVSSVLWAEGCRQFFVATLEEGIELRGFMPQPRIGVFQGLLAGEEMAYAEHGLIPVLNEPGQVERFAHELGAGHWAAGILHVDTGMTRLGLTQTELEKLLAQSLIPNPQSLLLMSHLACANDPQDAKNAEQLARFQAARALLPGVHASLANSSGLFLTPDFHADLGRPGCALYGINPTNGKNPMQPVARLSAPLLQIRRLDRDETIGYGATADAKAGSRIAIVALGYADGYMRMLSNQGFAYLAGQKAPLLGRVSMDMVALNVSHIAERLLNNTVHAEFINDEQTVDDIAHACNTIGYEIFTRIGTRVKRVYV